MNQASDDDAMQVAADGILVEKGFEAEDFPVPAMRFAIASRRDEPVTVRVADEIPEEFSMDGVGFHPDYEGENWTAYEDHRVEYERTLEPGEQVVTVYGIRASTMEEVQAFLVEPLIEEVKPAGADMSGGNHPAVDDQTIQDIAPKESNQVVRDVLAGDRETLPGMERTVDSASPDGTEDDATGGTDATAGADHDPANDDLADLELGDEEADELLDDLGDELDDQVSREDDTAGEEAEDAQDAVDLGLDDEDDFSLDFDEETGDADQSSADPDPSDEPADPELDVDFGDIPETDDLDVADEDTDEQGVGESTPNDDVGEPARASDGETTETPADPSVEAQNAPTVGSEEDSPVTPDEPTDPDVSGDPDEQTAVDLEIDPDDEGPPTEEDDPVPIDAAESTSPEFEGEPDVSLDLDPTEEVAEPEVDDADSGGDGLETGPVHDSGPVEAADDLGAGEEPTTEDASSDADVGSVDGDVASDDNVTDDPEEPPEPDDVDDGVGPVGHSIESVVEALAAELRDGTAGESDLQYLREELGVGTPSSTNKSVETRLQQLESRMQEFEAYTDALREFIDERGTAGELLDGLQAEMEDLRNEVATLTDSVEDNANSVESIGEAAGVLESDLASVSSDVSRLSDRIEDVDAGVQVIDERTQELPEAFEGLESELATFDSALEDLQSNVDDVDAGLQRIESTVDDNETRISAVAGDVSSVEEDLNAELVSLQSKLGSLEDDVQELAEWRGQLGEMFK